jgi:hypothetical protein
MAQIPYRANLSAAIFPMTLARSGRTVINPQADNNFDKRVDAQGNDKASAGIPQVMYMENVLPTVEGFQSVGYVEDGTVAGAEVGINCIENISVATTVIGDIEVGDISIEDEGESESSWTAVTTYLVYGGTATSDLSVFGPPPYEYPDIGIPFDAAYDNVASFAVVLTDIHPTLNAYSVFHYSGVLEVSPAHFESYYRRELGNLSSVTEWSTNLEFYLAPGFSNVPDAGDQWEARLDLGLGVSAAGAGLRVVYSLTDEKLYIKTSTGGWDNQNQTTLSEFSLILSATTWYVAKITSARNPDTNTRDVSVRIETTGGTLLALLTASLPDTHVYGNYLGLALDTPKFDMVPGAAYTPNMVAITNILFEAEVPDTSTQVLANMVSIDVAFLGDNNVTASRAELPGFENLTVVVPDDFVSPASSDYFTFASVRGRCFVGIRRFFSGTFHLYEVTCDLDTLVFTFDDITEEVAATFGELFEFDSVLGVVGSYNYLILYTAVSTHWSSTTTPTDFSASLVSGAGSEYVANLKGDITFCKPHVGGFFIYTTGNVIYCIYTGNARYPWKFREVSESSGYSYSQQVSGDTNSETHRGISNSRAIQGLSPDGARLAASEVSNFLERTKVWDTYDFSTNTFSVVQESELRTLVDINEKYRLWFYLDRYILVPYDQESPDDEGSTWRNRYSKVLVFDTLLQRYGKLSIPHHTILANSKSIYFFDHETGQKHVLNFDIHSEDLSPSFQSILLLGKFQFVRGNFLTLQQVSIESTQDEDLLTREFTVRVFRTLDGKNFLASVPLVLIPSESIGTLATYRCRVAGQNFSIGLLGKFDANTLDMRFTVDGSR